jgi:hypothetical protein
MKRVISLVMIFVMLSFATGCYTLTHQVGDGAQSSQTETSRQWYVLWGLVPLNDVDSKDMAGDAEDYTITSQITPLDFIINIFTGWVTVYSQTVKVEK